VRIESKALSLRLLESFPRKIRFSEVKIAKAPELRLILLTISFFLLCISLHGQEQAVTTPDTPVQNKRVIQFTGVVMEMDSFNVIPGVHVYLPKGGRGTTTNPYGFFSIAVVEGDSIVFSAVGFKRTHFIVPRHESTSSLKVIVTLESDVTFLEEVEVFPFPTEEMFKRAVVTMQLPYNRENANLQAWINATYMKDGGNFMAASPAMNQRYFQDQQVQMFQNKFGPQTNNLLNPWAWNSFIRSIKGN